VHIFRSTAMEAVAVEALNCTVYGAAFTGPESPALLENFRAGDGIAIGILHGDPTQASSPYCPVTAEQVAASNLDYLALGHIHKGGQLRSGKTLCAWPGCPMGRGFDELDSKGVLIVTGENGQWDARFRALDTPRFFDLECEAGLDPAAALGKLLPAAGSQDFYRVTFTGEAASVSLPQLQREFDRFPNLTLRDRTVPPVDPWASAGDDTLEGVYFQMLHDAMDGADEETCRRILLAAPKQTVHHIIHTPQRFLFIQSLLPQKHHRPLGQHRIVQPPKCRQLSLIRGNDGFKKGFGKLADSFKE
jgi:hypothetical protein